MVEGEFGRRATGREPSPPSLRDGPPLRAGEDLALADPERALAVAYAPATLRPALTALFTLDERFGAIVASTSEPMIGLMRLAWWREALERLDAGPVPAEPLLRALADHALPRGAAGAMLAAIEDGWAALLDGEPDEDAIARHGRERGAKLFEAAARLLGAMDDRVAAAGEGWALADLAHRHSSPAVRQAARAQAAIALARTGGRPWPRPLRPLAMLAVLARADAATERRAQGSPRRLARMLAMRLSGR